MPWKPLPQPGGDPPRSVGESLDRVTRALGAGRASAVTAVFGRWDELVGADIAAHATPRSLRDGVLVVTVEEPGWATQLRYMEADLVARLSEAAGTDAVTRIEVRVAPRST